MGRDHEGEIGVDETDDDGRWRVEQIDGIEFHRGECAVEKPFVFEDRDPCIGADEEAGPEGDHDEDEQAVSPFFMSPRDGERDRVANNEAEKRCQSGVEERSPEDFEIEDVDDAFVVFP